MSLNFLLFGQDCLQGCSNLVYSVGDIGKKVEEVNIIIHDSPMPAEYAV